MSLEHSPLRSNRGEARSVADDTFMPQRAVSVLLGVSERTLERWRTEGIGPCHHRFGRKVMYARSDVLGWADGQRRSSTSDQGRAG